jgi:two-component system NtrC family sensor kinase
MTTFSKNPLPITMKKALTLALLLFTFFTAAAQRKQIDSLRLVLRKAVTDTDKFNTLHDLGLLYISSYPDSAILFGQQAFLLAKKNNRAKNEANALNFMANAYVNMGDYASSLQYYFKALRIYERTNVQVGICQINNNIGNAYMQKGDYQKALPYFLSARRQLKDYTRRHQLEGRSKLLKPILLANIGESYLDLQKADSAKYYLGEAYKSDREVNDRIYIGNLLRDLGVVEGLKGNTKGALQYFRQALVSDKAINDGQNLSVACLSIATLYHKNKLQDSAVYYGQRALDAATGGNFKPDALNASKALYSYYDEAHNQVQAFKYFKLSTAIKDSLYSQDKVKQLLTLDFNEKQRQQELQAEQAGAQKEAQNRLRTYIFSGGLGVLLLLALIFWLNGRQRQKANKLLHRQKEDIEKAMAQLKLTQNQLIQSEKMASLGELTAGIAHEIQNPLNFVNNFSEVNRELLVEMKEGIDKGDLEEIRIIANNLIENEEKINHHGKRADFIVKGMLQHSRSGSGERQLTQINTLAEEFFKLSYQGLRAKDKSFNSDMATHFDPNLPKANVVQQDMGRVLLNLFNNAFYAVNQKAKTAGADYKPEVTLTTFVPPSGGWGLSVKDNGVGIPYAIKEKILQPFFTTKPTGEGTGLGLSLSYDILVKGHNGTLDIISKEGEGSEFIVRLPLA